MDTWARAVDEAMAAGREVIALQQFPETYRSLPYTFAGTRVLAAPPATPAPPDAIQFGPHALWPDWRWLSGDAANLRPGNGPPAIHLDAWRPVPYGALTVFLHVGQPEPPVAQVDLPVRRRPGWRGRDVTLAVICSSRQPSRPAVDAVRRGVYARRPIDHPGKRASRGESARESRPVSHADAALAGPRPGRGSADRLGRDNTLPGGAYCICTGNRKRTGTIPSDRDTAGGRWAPVTAQVGTPAIGPACTACRRPSRATLRAPVDGRSVLLLARRATLHPVRAWPRWWTGRSYRGA